MACWVERLYVKRLCSTYILYTSSPPAVGDLKGATFEPEDLSARISKPRIRHAPFSRHNTRCGPSQEFLSLKLKGGGGGGTGTGSETNTRAKGVEDV
jgi:hypothetical protein